MNQNINQNIKKLSFAIMILVSGHIFANPSNAQKIESLLDEAIEVVNNHAGIDGYDKEGRYQNQQITFERDGETISITDIRTTIEADGTVRDNATKALGKVELKDLRYSDKPDAFFPYKQEYTNSQGESFTCYASSLITKSQRDFEFSIPALNLNFKKDFYTVTICDKEQMLKYLKAIKAALKLKNKKPGLFGRF